MAPKRMTRSSAKAIAAKATQAPQAKRGRKPTKKNVETEPEIEIETAPTSGLEHNLKDAVTQEVHQVLTSVMPSVMKEMMKEIKKAEKKGHAKKSVEDDKEEEEEESEKVGGTSSRLMTRTLRIKGRGATTVPFRGADPLLSMGKGSAATLEWLSEMEAVIDISECRTDQAVKFAAHSFTGLRSTGGLL
ncbi:hypothetical protein QVD17_30512 [Tagetes erecta]|uniref:Uncharacterized protein n=1 Tax=Tagetes erecta TaxID=13708 RepID=A0AAD8K201_TARER|nr:hypothetical protein QVD17_30512 [Tagetes erecta]